MGILLPTYFWAPILASNWLDTCFLSMMFFLPFEMPFLAKAVPNVRAMSELDTNHSSFTIKMALRLRRLQLMRLLLVADTNFSLQMHNDMIFHKTDYFVAKSL